MPYELKKEGETFLSCVARVPEGVDRQRVSFSVGDALALPADMKGEEGRERRGGKGGEGGREGGRAQIQGNCV